MNYKEEVISRMRALIDMGRSPSVEMLERWVIMLEPSEQQTPPVATGEPRAGGSSVQPEAKFEMALIGLMEEWSKAKTQERFWYDDGDEEQLRVATIRFNAISDALASAINAMKSKDTD